MFNSLEYERTRRNIDIKEQFSDVQKKSWANTRSSHRFLAKRGTNLVVFCHEAGHLKVVKTLTCVSFDVDPDLGVTSNWFDGQNTVEVSYLPIEVAPSVFIAHPRLSSLEMRDSWGEDTLLFSLCYFTKANALKTAISGVSYILEESVFNKLNRH